jgi:hypothetical protein
MATARDIDEAELPDHTVRARDFKHSPARHMGRHERLKQLSMIWNSQMQKLMRDYKVLEPLRFVQKVNRESNGARA